MDCNTNESLYEVTILHNNFIMEFLFVCFVALRPKSTAMVMARRSVHITTLFPGKALTSTSGLQIFGKR